MSSRRVALAPLVAVVLVAACGATSPTGSIAPVSPGAPSVLPSTGIVPPSRTTAASPPVAAMASATPSDAGPGPSGSLPIARDPALLAILPPVVDGVPVTEEPSSFGEAVTDPDFVANVQAAAFAVAVDSGDLASGVVAHLRPGVYSDAFFRAWRDSYDTGACSQAGGVTGNAETELGGRRVYITHCVNGLLVYHAYLPGRDTIVSMFSVGDRRFGEQLMRDLRP